MNNNIIPPSRFSYELSCTIKKTSIKTEEPTKNKEIIGSKTIISIFAKYGFLNLDLIRRTLKLKKHRINANKTLKNMILEGIVDKYTIFYGNNHPNNDVYVLSTKGRSLLTTREMRHSIYRYDMSNIPYILEKLAIAQWHISVLEHSGIEVMYNHRVHYSNNIVIIPSLNIFRLSRIGHKIHIATVCAPQGIYKKDLGRFVTQVVKISQYLNQNRDRYRSFILCVVCRSKNHLEDISNLLSKIRETRSIYILYSIDTVTADYALDPLAELFEVKNEKNTTQTTIVSLRNK